VPGGHELRIPNGLAGSRADLQITLRAQSLLTARGAVEAALEIEHANRALFCVFPWLVFASEKGRKLTIEHLPAEHPFIPCESAPRHGGDSVECESQGAG
jgi:hypothetical protein